MSRRKLSKNKQAAIDKRLLNGARGKLVSCLARILPQAEKFLKKPIKETPIHDVWLEREANEKSTLGTLHEALRRKPVIQPPKWGFNLQKVALPDKGVVKRSYFSGLKWPILEQASEHVIHLKSGSIGVLVVDLRAESSDYQRYTFVRLTEKKSTLMLIPEGCAFAYYGLARFSKIELRGRSKGEFQFLKALDVLDPSLGIDRIDGVPTKVLNDNRKSFARFETLTPWDSRISHRVLTRGERMIINAMDVASDREYQIKPKGVEFVFDESCDRGVLHVREYSAFIQVLGKLKYLFAGADKARGARMGIAFRGQVMGYGDHMIPSLYRGVKTDKERKRRESHLSEKIKRAVGYFDQLKKLDDSVVEALFQQYGVDTSWIDAVDNVWIALWFACHRAECCLQGRSVHYVRRDPNKECPNVRYAYIVVFGYPDSVLSGTRKSRLGPGHVLKDGVEYIDLRLAVPSQFVRPHAQHGLMLRQYSDKREPKTDYRELVQAIIRIDLVDALRWLGSGEAVSLGALFPPPVHDAGFQGLLRMEDRTKLKHSDMYSELKVKEAGGEHEYKSLSFQRFDI